MAKKKPKSKGTGQHGNKYEQAPKGPKPANKKKKSK